MSKSYKENESLCMLSTFKHISFINFYYNSIYEIYARICFDYSQNEVYLAPNSNADASTLLLIKLNAVV